MRVGVLVTGDPAVRAAHSLQAHPLIDEVVVVGPAKSKSFEVVDDPAGCDLLVGHGPQAPKMARQHHLPLVWDGKSRADSVIVWGASPPGLALALAARESDPRLVAVAHPELPNVNGSGTARFPDPVGRIEVGDRRYAGRPVAMAHSPNQFAACLAIGASRRVTVVDQADFMSGIALAAGVMVADHGPGPVWERALPYLQAATEMGLVMAESA